MKTQLFKKLSKVLLFLPVFSFAQVDLAPGINYSYNPPTGCNNKITSLHVDVCNNGSAAAGSFLVSMYLYDSGSGNHWCIDTKTINSLSGNACVSDTNWNIDIYGGGASAIPPPGTYKLGIWVDTANSVAETNENNNTGILSPNGPDIQVCANNNSIRTNIIESNISIFPVPAATRLTIKLSPGLTQVYSIEVLDLSGRSAGLVDLSGSNGSSDPVTIPVSDLENGTYLLKFRMAEGIICKKFAVNR